MFHLKAFNYMLISLISSGLTYHYFDTVNKNEIVVFKTQLDKLLKENIELRKELRDEKDIDGDIQKIISKIDDCLTKLMKNIMEMDLKKLDPDLKDEINNICKRIIHYLSEQRQEETKKSVEYGKFKENDRIESYDNLIDELKKLNL